ncbi:MAG TPA: ABC transporter substrate-binding protein [Acidimicrobiales bacterium]|nr:ABC transporter substrate-binding protein [Acidimicrobiales bacterium]
MAVVGPFTGKDASLGPPYLAACLASTRAINQAGGVMGHQLTCKSVDTRGDPADAIPAVRKLFASSSNLAAIIGVTSDTAASIVPVINNNKTVMFAMTGQSEFDHKHFKYFFRLVPPDLEEGRAMVAIAKQKHYTKVALAFGNDIGSQTFVKPALASLKKENITVTANETLNLSANTFRTEASRIVSSHPQAILTEALGPAEATFLSEVKQLNGGKLIPVIATGATVTPSWYKAVSSAVGAKALSNAYSADQLAVKTSGSAYKVYKTNMTAIKGKLKGRAGNFSALLTSDGAIHLYDGINLAALSMLKAKSVSPATYQKDIVPIANGTSGATVVQSFAQGKKALSQGKTIRYVGPGGKTHFDSYHDSKGIFQVVHYSPSGNVNVVGNISHAQLNAVTP